MNLEKEYRYKVNKEIINKILEVSEVLEEKKNQVDLTLGYEGFNSLSMFGYVCRVRKKGNSIWMEVKKRIEDNAFIESTVKLDNFKEGVELFKAIGMKPYLYMNRTREILKYKGLKIFIDNIDILGDYVEIEIQDSINPEKEYIEFIELIGIKTEPQPLYGDIFKEKLEDIEFKKIFEKRLEDALSEI